MRTPVKNGLTAEQKRELYSLVHKRANEVDVKMRGLAFRTLWAAAKAPFAVIYYRDIPTASLGEAMASVKAVDLVNLTPDRLPTLGLGQLQHKNWSRRTRTVLAHQMTGFLGDLEAEGVPCKGALLIWQAACRELGISADTTTSTAIPQGTPAVG
ncbi:MAG: hypothetical protein ACE5FN_12660 [Leptospirillia bacterium]